MGNSNLYLQRRLENQEQNGYEINTELQNFRANADSMRHTSTLEKYNSNLS